ncbi:MAG: hypothetical protein LIP11_17110, partial [Clostridiales bacterium]|nr:hypothetical protein [Clostridiales bacterium]
IVYEAYRDEDGYLCIDFDLDVTPGGGTASEEILDADTSALTIIPYNREVDGEGKYIPGTETELGWGSFTITFE